MRESGRSPVRGRGRWVLLVAVAAASLVVGTWPAAEATPTRVEALTSELESPAGEYRKAMKIEELRTIDSSTARTALAGLADSTDERLAMLAIRALGRNATSSATSKVADIYADTGRSDLVRATALAVWCQIKADAGRSWSDIKSWVKSTAGTDSALRGQYAACKARHWPNEVDNDL
jgi:hypothetical protein